MLAKLMRLLEKIVEMILVASAVGAQLGNAFICIFMLILGPSFVIGLVSQ